MTINIILLFECVQTDLIISTIRCPITNPSSSNRRQLRRLVWTKRFPVGNDLIKQVELPSADSPCVRCAVRYPFNGRTTSTSEVLSVCCECVVRFPFGKRRLCPAPLTLAERARSARRSNETGGRREVRRGGPRRRLNLSSLWRKLQSNSVRMSAAVARAWQQLNGGPVNWPNEIEPLSASLVESALRFFLLSNSSFKMGHTVTSNHNYGQCVSP